MKILIKGFKIEQLSSEKIIRIIAGKFRNKVTGFEKSETRNKTEAISLFAPNNIRTKREGMKTDKNRTEKTVFPKNRFFAF